MSFSRALRQAAMIGISTGVLALTSPVAMANPIIHYTLQGVTMTAGATLTGSFDYDATIGKLVDFDLTAPSNAYGAATEFNPSNSYNSFQSFHGTHASSILLLLNSNQGYLNLDFMDNLDAGGTIALLLLPTAGSYNHAGSFFSHNDGTGDKVTGGVAIAGAAHVVPEPVSSGLFMIGLLALGSLHRRRQSHASR